MPATSSTLRSVPVPASRAPDPATDVEVLARRTLGIAVNAIHNGGHSAPLSGLEPSLAERAKALLERRVPSGPELQLALELLDRAAVSERGAAGIGNDTSAVHPSVAPSYELRMDGSMSG